MQLIELQQGSEAWKAFRLNHYPASEAAAMLGVSPYMTRDELLKQKKTGITPEVSEHQQRIFDQGHQIEALLSPIAEKELGQELFPCVGVLEGSKLSASFDGLTMDERTVFEAKTLSQELIKAMAPPSRDGQGLPLHYRVQLEQQLLVSGASMALFMAGSLNDDGSLKQTASDEYRPDPQLRQRIIDGWQQFEKDLANYEVKEPAAPVIGQTPEALNALPVLHIAASGQLVASNLDEFKTKALNALAQINTNLQTDQDFADAEQSAKCCKQIASALIKAQETLLSGAGIAVVVNELEAIKGRFNTTRLQLEKAIKSEKENRKRRYIEVAEQRVREYVNTLNEALPVECAILIPARLIADLTTAIKGLKTLSSIQNALDSVVLRYESEANQDYQRKQQAQADALQAETAPPVSSSEAELAHIDKQQALLNRQLYPLQILNFTEIKGLQEAMPKSWHAVKQALINHIERSIPA